MRSLLAFLSFCFVSFIHAEEPAKAVATDYTATINGVVCSACKAHVTAALKKLPGVENVSIARGDKEGTATVTFNSSSAALTRDDAVKALGEDAKTYEVLSLEKSK